MAAEPRPAVLETERSTLFFYRDRVVKVRRPLADGLADLSSLERRHRDVEREVTLNRRLAPDVYVGTATIALEGTAVEHAVVMRRLPKHRNLATLIRRRRNVDEHVERVAAVLARFHAEAPRDHRIDAAATGAALWQRWQAVEDELSPFIGSVVGAERYRALTAAARRYIDGREPLFLRRVSEGAVCDGHGDLEAANIFCLDDGPRIISCVEFDEERRFGDVLVDVAALVQDLEILGARPAVDALLGAYRRCSEVELPTSLLHFYVAVRAHGRLLSECLRQRQGLPMKAVPAVLLDQAAWHLEIAAPRLVLVGGPPASGKSTLAAWLGTHMAAEVVSAASVGRREDARAAGEQGRTAHPARGPWRRSAYEGLCDRAGALLATGRSVVLDAPWTTTADRQLAAEVARRASAPVVALRCQCPQEERAVRQAARRGASSTGGVAGGVGPEAVDDPWPEALVVDTSSGASEPSAIGPSQTRDRSPTVRRRSQKAAAPLGPPAKSAG